tara:strand:- start:1409 stop:2137 length:729 start_codon:yes stop_codon:yes gene_type:complete
MNKLNNSKKKIIKNLIQKNKLYSPKEESLIFDVIVDCIHEIMDYKLNLFNKLKTIKISEIPYINKYIYEDPNNVKFELGSSNYAYSFPKLEIENDIIKKPTIEREFELFYKKMKNETNNNRFTDFAMITKSDFNKSLNTLNSEIKNKKLNSPRNVKSVHYGGNLDKLKKKLKTKHDKEIKDLKNQQKKELNDVKNQLKQQIIEKQKKNSIKANLSFINFKCNNCKKNFLSKTGLKNHQHKCN